MNKRCNLLLVGCCILVELNSSCGRSSAANRASARPEVPTITWPTETGATMEVAEAVMVTAELDFGPKMPSVEEALRAVDRRYQPDDGFGRTFAVLDAYGEPTADGKLHISMHVSSEKPGRGALVFRQTGQVLWHARITPAINPAHSAFTGGKLDIMISDEQGNDHLLNGSGVSQSILDAPIQDRGLLLREFWPEGAERQLTFFYSACGCPVKILCQRLGERILRTKKLPVIFPDDPAVVTTINHLLGWGES